MVEKFGYDAATITLLYLLNHAINMFLAPKIGKLIGKWGERRALTFEYIGLFFVFVSYAFVENHILAGGLYVIDHLFFAMSIAIKTYFQKIAIFHRLRVSALRSTILLLCSFLRHSGCSGCFRQVRFSLPGRQWPLCRWCCH